MEALEIIKILLLFIIAIEVALMKHNSEEAEKDERASRREVNGTFKNPLGDGYRKNVKGQYVPIHPNSRMLDGSDEDDDL